MRLYGFDKNTKKVTESSVLGNYINIYYKYKKGWGLSQCTGTSYTGYSLEEGG